jgi:hypothetical protein
MGKGGIGGIDKKAGGKRREKYPQKVWMWLEVVGRVWKTKRKKPPIYGGFCISPDVTGL